VAQGGLWDVDGNGLQPIEDASLAKAIRDKVNQFNKEKLIQSLVFSAAFCFFPFRQVIEQLFDML
jgi:hypothetical protein